MSLISPQEQNKPHVWFDINSSTFFTVYRVEGVCPEDSEEDIIVFEVNSSYLQSALGQKTATYIEIKLRKDGFPFFNVNMKFRSAVQDEKDATHLVPVIIVPRIQWTEFVPPYSKIDFDFQAKCPRLPIFKRFIDTFKYSKCIRIVLRKNNKTMTFEAESEVTRHSTVFENIEITEYGDSFCDDETVSVMVEHKSVAQWLHGISFRCTIHCMVQNNKTLKLCYRLGDQIIANFVQAAEFEEEQESGSEIDDSLSCFS